MKSNIKEVKFSMIVDISPLLTIDNDVEFRVDDFFNHTGTRRWGIPERTIDNNMLVYGIKGEGYYKIGGIKYRVKPGRIFLISHDVVHSSGQNVENPVAVLAVRFSAIKGNTGKEVFPKIGMIYDSVESQAFRGMLMDIHRILNMSKLSGGKDKLSKDILRNIAGDLMRGVIELMKAEVAIDNNNPQPRICEGIDSVIEQKIEEGQSICISDFTELFNLTPYKFLQIFKQYYNMTFKKYVYMKRMEFAKRLVIDTDTPIKEIAYLAGYSDQYIFSNQFKKLYQYPPTQYRAINNNFSREFDKE